MRRPFSTFQTVVELDLDIVQPERSFPLNNAMGFPHFGAAVLFRDGARSPVQGHTVPSGPVVVPERRSPPNFASKTMSSLRSSSSLGETNRRWPFVISTFGSGRALPQRPTIWAFNWPFSRVSSSQEGYSRSGAFSVRSQRPRNAVSELSGIAEEVLAGRVIIEWAAAPNDKVAMPNRRVLCIFMG